MGEGLIPTDSHLIPRKISSGHPIIQQESFPFQTIESNSPWKDFDDEPVIWFGPIIIAGLAILMIGAVMFFGLVAFFRGYFL